jgi:hypothetical protein
MVFHDPLDDRHEPEWRDHEPPKTPESSLTNDDMSSPDKLADWLRENNYFYVVNPSDNNWSVSGWSHWPQALNAACKVSREPVASNVENWEAERLRAKNVLAVLISHATLGIPIAADALQVARNKTAASADSFAADRRKKTEGIVSQEGSFADLLTLMPKRR